MKAGTERRCCLRVCVCVCVCVCVLGEGGSAQQETGGLGGVEGTAAQVLNSQLGPLCQALTLVSCKPWTLLTLRSISILSVSPAPDLGFISGALPDVWSLLSKIHFPETAVCQGPLHATEMRRLWGRKPRMEWVSCVDMWGKGRQAKPAASATAVG